MIGGRCGASAGGRGARGGLPGWSEEVEPFRQQSIYWHNVWLREGRPSHGWLHETMVKRRTQYHHAVRRLKRRLDLTRAKKLFQASMLGDTNLLKEMKQIKSGGGAKNELPDNVAGANGEEEIVEKFKDVYSTLYNSSGTQDGMAQLREHVQTLIGPSAINDVNKLDWRAVKNAACKLKPRKSDVSGSFTSDALLNAPDVLFHHLAAVFRAWAVHGTVTPTLLACAFLPLLKSNLKDPADTGSYRAIAGSSLILKLFEKTVMLVWGALLSSDSLQFGFKSGTSTTQCTWLVQEVVGHYLQGGSYPIAVVLDCSRAFDLCKFDILFASVLEKGMPAIIVRILMFMYEEQYAWVRWGDARSAIFNIVNGTRQGSIASPDLWAVYLDPLMNKLRELGVGCHIGDVFVGVMAYADDLILLAPNRAAAEQMLQLCQTWAEENNVHFSTDVDPSKSKSKAIFMCGQRSQLPKPSPLVLCGKLLPWVETASHLGHELHQSGNMDYDAKVKRGQYISTSLEIREMFSFASPIEILRAVKVYAGSFYGSNLWELEGMMASQVYSSWSINVKLAWSVPRATRSYIAKHLLSSEMTSARVDILSKYVNFFSSLRTSPSPEVSFMANFVGRDLRTVTGRNIRLLRDESGLDPWTMTSAGMKRALDKKEVGVPVGEEWRLPYLGKLLEQRQSAVYSDCTKEEERLTGLIDSLCTS